MAKLINTLLVAVLFFSCNKDKAEPFSLGEAHAFIEGEWEWRESIVAWDITGFSSYSGQNVFVKREEVSEYCILRFTNDGLLSIMTQNGTEIKKLKPYGIIKIGANRIAHFKSDAGERITFKWSAAQNQLNTEYNFFSFPAHPCNTGFLILSSSYEKS